MLNRKVKQRIAENKQRRALSVQTRAMLKKIGVSQRVVVMQHIPSMAKKMTDVLIEGQHYRVTKLKGVLRDAWKRRATEQLANSELQRPDRDWYEAMIKMTMDEDFLIGPASAITSQSSIGSAAEIEKAFFDIVGVDGLGPDKRAGELTVDILKARTTPSEFKIVPFDQIGDYIFKDDKEQ